MRHTGGVRRELGVPTAMNILGPLTNPAQPPAALVGCADARLAPALDRPALEAVAAMIPDDWLEGGDGPGRDDRRAAYAEYLARRLASRRFVEEAEAARAGR